MKVFVVVDDSDEMQIIIGRILGRDGRLELDGSATNATDAVEAAKNMQPDLVILDHFIDGPILGLEAAPLIKDVAPETKILLFSDFDLALQASREPAVDRFLPKKRLSELLSTVQDMLALSHS